MAKVPLLSFAIHVTYTCPLSCAHCCFSSSPQNRDRLHFDHIAATIDEIPEGIRLIAFTGGEPFLLGDALVNLVRRASGKGAKTRIVTSAYWAKSDRSCEKRLRPLVDAGLDELSVSWDDFHEKFVDFANVRNAWTGAKRLGLDVGISTVQPRTANGPPSECEPSWVLKERSSFGMRKLRSTSQGVRLSSSRRQAFGPNALSVRAHSC